MTLAELKDKILNYTLEDSFFIFVHPKNTFLPNQYIDAMCHTLELDKQIVSSIYDQESALSLVMPTENNLRVLYTEEFTEVCEDYSRFSNTIIVCEKIDKKILAYVEDYIVEFPKLLEWQVKDYMQTRCPNLAPANIEQLYKAAKGDIYKISNELDKLCLFPNEEQNLVFVELINSPGSDLYTLEFFEFIDAIMFKDKILLRDYFLHQKLCNFELYAVVNSLLAKAKGMLLAKYCPGLTAADIEISPNQHRFYQNTAKMLSMYELKHLIDVLSVIDVKVKTGELDIKNDRQIDYIITQLVD